MKTSHAPLTLPPMVAITGGIGSGKSAVCRILAGIGMEVYDCDSRAKLLMDSDPEIHARLREEISPEVVSAEGVIDRPKLASIVFGNPDKLAVLNAITHGKVRDDIRRWRGRLASQPVVFVETAILLESNLHLEADAVWLVDADDEIRLQRACRRDSASPERIRSRMASQTRVTADRLPCPLHIIDNNGTVPLLPALFRLLAPYGVTPTSAMLWKN